MKKPLSGSGGRSGAKRKPSKSVLSVVITAVIFSVVIIALLITDIFIPVKYLTAYVVSGDTNERGTMRVSFLDVGFGDCSVIELPDGKTVLIDGGDGSYTNTLHILKFLNSRGIDRIDFLICSSVKGEHCGGLAEIVKYKSVGRAYIPYCLNTRITDGYYAFVTALNKESVPYSYACVGEGFVGGDGYFLTFLSPANYLSPESEYAALNSDPTKENIENSSAVVWLEYRNTAFAFTSDIRAKGLKRIVEEYRSGVETNQPFCSVNGRAVRLENCKIFTAPGHGGENNTYAPWYDLIRPEQVIISAGGGYRDYPSNKALSDICNYCQPLYTMYNGDITVKVDGDGYKI